MKRVLPEFEYSAEQLNKIRGLAAECSLTLTTASILYGRGVDTAEKADKFLNPSKANFISPYKMRGMSEAVELITRAKDEEWDVLVYGDYDADGVCAATIMGGALKDFGLNVKVFVPERKSGYGVTATALEELFEEFFPQLVITVDCGISNAQEVEYLKECGCEVIVTDHHELPADIPDCICINPKFSDGYPYDNLCGAGVAFKVACALIGKEAHKYLDFAALATVADSVPLVGENRDIVAEGLKLINTSPRKCFSNFMNKSQESADAHSLAFAIAPKINAAGRMGDAASALKLFSSVDEKEISELSEKLTLYNQERQIGCDTLYMQAKEKLSKSGAYGRVIMLADDNWNSGFVGIVAARLAEEYGRPAILFVKNGEMLKGSARSIESVNIFEALKACSAYIKEFGGHSQAAGVNVSAENFASLEKALNEYMDINFTAEDFIPTLSVNEIEDARNFSRVAKELEMLEPYGVGNKRPLFVTYGESCQARPLKPQSPHLTFRSGGIEFMYFGGIRHAEILQCAAPKKIVFEYNLSRFRGKEYIRGFVRDVIYGADCGAYAAEYINANSVMVAAMPESECEYSLKTHAEIDSLMGEGDDGFGTVYLASDYSTLSLYKNAKKLGVDLFELSSRNLADVILVAPRPDCDLSGFKRVIWLDKPAGGRFFSSLSKDNIVCSDISGTSFLQSMDITRSSMAQIFSYISSNAGILEGCSAEETAFNNKTPFDIGKFLFALKVFEELSLISFSEGRLVIYRGAKTELSNSRLYSLVDKLKK